MSGMGSVSARLLVNANVDLAFVLEIEIETDLSWKHFRRSFWKSVFVSSLRILNLFCAVGFQSGRLIFVLSSSFQCFNVDKLAFEKAQTTPQITTLGAPPVWTKLF